MSDSSSRPSLAGPAMISVAIVILAGAIVYAARPRLVAANSPMKYWDDGTVAIGFDARDFGIEEEMEEMVPNLTFIRIGSIPR